MESEKKNNLSISVKSFITAIIVIFVLMVATYILTLLIPSGLYNRVEDENGNLLIDCNQVDLSLFLKGVEGVIL